MHTQPEVLVEIAFNAGYATAAADRVWTDVSDYVEAQDGVTIQRGRSDELSEIGPSSLSLTLDNSDGRFTPGNTAGAYYPNVKIGRPIRVTTFYPSVDALNLMSESAATIETDASDWSAESLTTPPTLSQSATRAHTGTKSLLIEWVSGDTFGSAAATVSNLTVGETYTMSAYVWVPAGDSAVEIITDRDSFASGGKSTLNDQWQRISYTFTAAETAHEVSICLAGMPAAGDKVWVDSIMVNSGDTASTFTTDGPSYRFTGYVNEWPVEWPDGTDARASVTISASSRMARLAQATPLRSLIEQEYLTDSPLAYYPMGESSGTQLGNQSVTTQPNLVVTGSGAEVDLGSGTGPGTDDLSAPTFAGGKYLATSTEIVLGLQYGPFTWKAFVNTSATSGDIIGIAAPDGYVRLCVTSAGKAALRITVGGSAVDVVTSTTSVNDGATHHVALAYADGLMEVRVDGVTEDTDSRLITAHRGVVSVGNGFVGTISHAAVSKSFDSEARTLIHSDAGLNGFEGETSDQRILRYADYGAIPVAEVAAETGLSTSIAHTDTTDRTPIDLMRQVAATEGGLLFDARDGSLVFHARDHRYNTASTVTLDVAAQEVAAELRPRMDNLSLVNDVTGTRVGGGAIIRAVDADSVAEHGPYRETLELLTTSDSEVEAAANWKVRRYAEPQVRIDSFEVDVLNVATTSTWQSFLSLDLGDRITVTNLPAQAPDATLNFFIEGTTETIGPEFYTMSLNVSAAGLSDVWQLDSATYSVLDTSTILAY